MAPSAKSRLPGACRAGPLVSIAVLTVITVAAGIAVPTVGDEGALPSSLPAPGLKTVELPGPNDPGADLHGRLTGELAGGR